mmetsp:Transcript_33336/g.49038  ORF Transcript_33336/g.49038 Transcript_33336/m.49038 type:complete len:304 (+) Transcript_33336:93-1004(+)|eukprot:CAMPEP_0195521088 /NCGR_PEP_ID=MMETSP0794_2-20130614/17913_1 /TAXON_ID=515487 /ORGANISM="Stephanopyxis turris, Strain CCMP 815" /LENGTH=303 /DNA_ID=CAMNT_0040650559 /DNA_START=88 /DNA_END=999 /DNA_ORIENTATION=+
MKRDASSMEPSTTTTNTTNTAATTISAVGFCGADDSVDPNLLGLISHAYPFVEFGVLFRPDKEGEPRYASYEWVRKLSTVASRSSPSPNEMRLAAHLCGSRVNDVLKGNGSFLSTLIDLGFQRVQINATAVNGVDTSELGSHAETLYNVMKLYAHKLQFIIQKNEETRPLWEGLLQHHKDSSSDDIGTSLLLPSNVSMLLDESKGTGMLSKSFPPPPIGYNVGYAGGIGPENIKSVLRQITEVVPEDRSVWVDMESSLRSTKNGVDVFDLDKCYKCISVVCASSKKSGGLNLFSHPDYLVQDL